MRYREAYEYGREQLGKAKIADADTDAWYLLEFVTGMTRAQYFLHMNEELPDEQMEKYRKHLIIRANHIPLQHITGVQEFMGLSFIVNENVLVPRQDTEVLVESVLNILEPGMEVLDMCTGSGCILISLLKLRERIRGTGVDISKEALAVAEKNADKIGVKARFLQSDLFSEVEGEYDVIVSNPPYIRTSVIEGLEEEVRCHEPRLALDGMEDGLYFYRKIIEESPKYLKRQGKLFFEIGHDQGEQVRQMMEEAGFCQVTVKKDLAGLDRGVYGVYI